MRAIISVLLLAVTLGAAPVGTARAGLGSAAPGISLKTLDGTPRTLGAKSGKVTVINFWATWCPPCRAETPDLIAAYRRLQPAGVNFVGIDTTETAPIVKTFLSAKGVPYPVALGSAAGYNAFGIAYIPTTIVLDADGIVRARWIGPITPAQLTHYVADARAHRSTVYASPEQTTIDTLLSPQRFGFDGSTLERADALTRAKKAVLRADEIAEKNEANVDYERTSHEQGALLYAAGKAERDYAPTAVQKVDGLSLMARGSGAIDDWNAAARTYREALGVTPNDAKLVGALSRAYYRLHDYTAMIEQARRYSELKPADGDGWADLGLAFARAHRSREAARVYERALSFLQSDAGTKPSQSEFADVADTSLDVANVYVALGDVGNARRIFAIANTYADRLAASGPYVALKRNVKERTQEGLIAAVLAARSTQPVVSVTAWTGPDLPGSLASTLKYRLIVAAKADAAVTLQAQGLRPDWVASFCADGLCSPRAVSFKSPPSGVKTYEFQLVPPQQGAQPGSIDIAVGGGKVVAVPTAR